MNLDNSLDNIYLKKALKYYLKLKENKEKGGIPFAHKSLDYIKKIKNKKKYDKVLQETEEYCNIYLKNSAINHTVDIDYNQLFKIIENGNLELFDKIKLNNKDIIKNNEDGLTPLHYCIKVGDTSILKKLLLYDVSINTINSRGNTLIEYACLCNDPNMINFLTKHGAVIKKNLFLRDKKVKIKLKTNNLDCACICKIMIMNSYQKDINEIFNKIKKLVDFETLCGFGNFTIKQLLIGIGESLDETSLSTYIDILVEELSYELQDQLFCYKNKVEVLIYNLIPFIEYKFNITQENIFLMELYFLKKKFNKKKLIELLFEKYIEKLVPEDFLGIQIKKIINKF
tara:strand:- start:2456 stop:3481 length:1026 start_codon:yes stop_codon:yes gene_type:complete